MNPENKKDAEKALESVYSVEYEAEGVYREIEIRRLIAWDYQPFHLYSEDEMAMMILSIQRSGVITPVIVREREGGTHFDIISGHHRVEACRILGMETVPCVIRKMSMEDAMICMIDSNLRQRTKLTPSEKAEAYRLKAEAIKKKEERGVPVGPRKIRDQLGIEGGDSSTQVQRYLRLNELIPEFQKKVDDGTMALRSGVDLSYLSPAEQKTLWSAMLKEQVVPTMEQAKKIRALSTSKACSARNLRAVLTGKEIETQEAVKPEDLEPREKSAALQAPGTSEKVVFADATGQENAEEPAPKGEPVTVTDASPIPERVIWLPWSALAPYFSADMTDAEVKQAILDLLRQHGERREHTAPRLVALP